MQHKITQTKDGGIKCTCGLVRDKNFKRIKRGIDPKYNHSFAVGGLELSIDVDNADPGIWDIWRVQSESD